MLWMVRRSEKWPNCFFNGNAPTALPKPWPAKNVELFNQAATCNDRLGPFLEDWKNLSAEKRQHELKKVDSN
jgi:hypothetical protein